MNASCGYCDSRHTAISASIGVDVGWMAVGVRDPRAVHRRFLPEIVSTARFFDAKQP
jgi:hypothetical protein